jgi:hypothetical protein
VTPTVCPGSCNTAWRRAEAALAETGTEHALTPNWGRPAHCDGCTTRTRHQLAALPELLAAVHLEALHGTRVKTSGTIGRIHNPAWPGEAARMLTDLIGGGLADLADDVAHLRRLTPPGAVGEARRINKAAALLLAHWDWAVQHHPCAAELWERDSANPGAQAAGWYRIALRFTRRDRLREQLIAPCPHCHLRTLARDDGDQWIECRNPLCGLLLSGSEYRQHTQALTMGSKAAAAA